MPPSGPPDFEAPWWLRSGHLQTVWQTLFRHGPEPAFLRERLELPDGDFLDLDHSRAGGRPTVLLLHGLEGSSRSPYIRGMVDAIVAAGWRAVVLHFRGCSGTPNRLPRTYHSGDTADARFVIETLTRRDPGLPLVAVGFSLGGNVLLKLLGEGAVLPLRAAVAVSVPMVLEACAARLSQGLSRLYQWWLIRSLQRKLELKPVTVDAPVDFRTVRQHRTFLTFDHHVTAPLHGFGSGAEYYRKASSRQYLRGVRTPTLIVQARDDPFLTQAVLPRPDELSDQIHLEVSDTGGHLGFVYGGSPWRARYWLEERVPAFLGPYL